MRRALLALITLTVFAIATWPVPASGQEETDTAVATDTECDPYPIGRCGAFQREEVLFCYVLQGGVYLAATDETVMPFGPSEQGVTTGNPLVDEAMLYLRTAPWDTFIGDPNTAPFPSNFLYQESNAVDGLQPKNFKCGTWTWFAECVPQQWMGPTGVVNKAPDTAYL